MIEEIKKNKLIYFGLLGIVILSGFLRLWGLGNNSFVADEFLDVNATYGYHKTGEWQAWDFNHGDVSVRDNKASDKRAWLYRWQVATVLDRLEPTEFTFRLVSALWGIVTTIILYFVTLSFTKNRWIALISAFLWAVSVPAIEMNRKIRMYSMFAPIFLLFSWSLFKFIDSVCKCSCTKGACPGKMIYKGILRVNWNYLIPVVLLGALSYHLHQLTGNIVLVLISYFVVMMFINRREIVLRRYSAYLILMILGFVSVKIFLPDIWNQFVNSMVFFDNHWSYVGHILSSYWHPVLGLLLMLVGSWYLLRRTGDERPGAWIIVTFFVTLLSAIFLWNRNVGPQYIFFVEPFGFILVASGVYWVADTCRNFVGSSSSVKRGSEVFMGVILLFALLLPSYNYFFQKDNTYHITSKADSPNYRKIFLFVKKNIDTGDGLITRNFRSYYYGGLDVAVLDFGSERSEDKIKNEGKVKKVTLEDVKKFASDKNNIWVVYSDNDEKFITKEARAYFEENCEKQNDLLVRGKVSVYKCKNEQKIQK